MNTDKNSFFVNKKQNRTYIIVSITISLILLFGMGAYFLLCPDFILKSEYLTAGGKSWLYYMKDVIFAPGSPQAAKIACIISICFTILLILLACIMAFIGLLMFIYYIFGDKWHRTYIAEQAKIINSCNPQTFTDRVAIVIPTCNDFSPNSLLQTASQTYKHCDVWISNDSNNPDVIKTIETFAKEHGFHVIHRSAEHKKAHPSKVGNLMYFVEQLGDQYDFILENDSSSIITSTFVENSLCYFHSPLLDTNKTGAVICFGSFYGPKNLLSLVNSGTSQWNDSFGLVVGCSVKTCGHPVLLDGWGSFYKMSALKNINLDKVECPSDDMARGLCMTRNGYLNYLNPFDFAGKFGPQNIEGWKVQRLKWNGGDIFCIRNGLVFKYLNNKFSTTFVWFQFFSIGIMIPLTFILGVTGTVLSAIMNVYYFNITSTIIAIAFGLVGVAVVITLLLINKCPLMPFIIMAISGTLEGAIGYKRAFHIVINCIIRHKWSSSAVTVKGISRTTKKQKVRMSIFDFVIFMFALAICFTLTFAVPQLNKFIIWFNIFGFIAGPSILYILWVWIGEIRVKTGWSDEYKIYEPWKHDFRYKYVKESEIWVKQHGK